MTLKFSLLLIVPLAYAAAQAPKGDNCTPPPSALAPTLPAKLSASRNYVGSPAKSDGPAGTLDDFKKRLEKSAGKTVTVVLQEDGRENRFTFSVSRNALK